MKHNWYVVHVYSGYEKKVAQHVMEQAVRVGLSDQIAEVLIPSENVVDVKHGRKVFSEQKYFPGYVLVKMEMTDDAWHLVKNSPKVTGFLGGRLKPIPLSENEANRIISQSNEVKKSHRLIEPFTVGENVRVSEGPFATFNGVIEELDEERGRLKLTVSIFGRSTLVELEFSQVEKL